MRLALSYSKTRPGREIYTFIYYTTMFHCSEASSTFGKVSSRNIALRSGYRRCIRGTYETHTRFIRFAVSVRGHKVDFWLLADVLDVLDVLFLI